MTDAFGCYLLRLGRFYYKIALKYLLHPSFELNENISFNSNGSLTRCHYYNTSGLLSSSPNKRFSEVSNSRQYFASHLNSGGRLRRGLGAFFIYKSEKKDRIHEKRQEEIKQDHDTRQQQIRIHCNTIVSEYNQHRFKARPLEMGRAQYFSEFVYARELLEHLYTGHREIYDLFNAAKQSENNFSELSNKLFREIQQRIKTELGNEIVFHQNAQVGHPTFNDEAVVTQIMDEIEINNFYGFYTDSDNTGARIIKWDQRYHHLHNSDQELADKVALKLNEIVDDPQTIQDVSAYRKTRERKDIGGQKFSEQLTSLIHDIGLGTKFLGGACYGCLNLHDEKDIPQLQLLLSQPH
jgi:hypothetical protein